MIFKKLNIDTNEVLNAAKTKWNFNYFTPGLVGDTGMCRSILSHSQSYRTWLLSRNDTCGQKS